MEQLNDYVWLHSVIMHNRQATSSQLHRMIMTAIEIYKHLTIQHNDEKNLPKMQTMPLYHQATLSNG